MRTDELGGILEDDYAVTTYRDGTCILTLRHGAEQLVNKTLTKEQTDAIRKLLNKGAQK